LDREGLAPLGSALFFRCRVECGEPFRGRRFQKLAVGAGESDFESFFVQEQGTREMNGIGTSERMVLAEPGHEMEHRSAERYLCEPLPIVGKGKPGLLEFGCQQEPFPASASERRVDLGESQV
jgi:hypothetical protein